MTKKELVDKIAEATDIAKSTVEKVLDSLGDVACAELLGGGEVPVPGLGKLKAVKRAACTRRNPKTGGKVEVPAKGAVKYVPAGKLKEAMK